MATEKDIVVASSELKLSKTKKQYQEVIDQDGIKYSCWETGLWNTLGKGLGAHIEFEQKGIFKNIIAAETITEDVPEIPPDFDPQQLEKEEGKRKNKVNALKGATDLAVAGKIKETQVIFVAELFYEYLEGNVTVPEEVILKLVREQVKAELSIRQGTGEGEPISK